jgi:hypothetical protein
LPESESEAEAEAETEPRMSYVSPKLFWAYKKKQKGEYRLHKCIEDMHSLNPSRSNLRVQVKVPDLGYRNSRAVLLSSSFEFELFKLNTPLCKHTVSKSTGKMLQQKVLLLGATGHTGSSILEGLIEYGGFVSALLVSEVFLNLIEAIVD